MQVVVDSLLTNYVTVGSGKKTALFLHGWADSLQTFDNLSQQFVKDNRDFTVVSLDLPGFGGTQAPSEAWGLEEYAHYVASFLKKIKRETTLILGHSNGGAIAIYGLSSGILDADGLVLMASAGIRPKTTRNRLLKIASVPAKIALKAAPRQVRNKVRRRAYSAIGSDYMVSEHMQETFKLVVARDVTLHAKQLQLATCLIYGDNDTATPVSYGKQFHAAIPDSRLHVIPQASHFLHQEQTPKVATIISDFAHTL